MTTTTTISATDQITEVINHYIQAGVAGDAQAMSRSFHDDATIYSVVDGRSEGGPIQILFDAIDGNPAATLTGVIGPIEIHGTIATATAVLKDWGGSDFTDQFALLETSSGWQIITKIYFERT